jgi:hypothetical protein
MLASQRKQQILQILAEEKQVMSGISASALASQKTPFAGICGSWPRKANCSASTAARCRFRSHRAN